MRIDLSAFPRAPPAGAGEVAVRRLLGIVPLRVPGPLGVGRGESPETSRRSARACTCCADASPPLRRTRCSPSSNAGATGSVRHSWGFAPVRIEEGASMSVSLRVAPGSRASRDLRLELPGSHWRRHELPSSRDAACSGSRRLWDVRAPQEASIAGDARPSPFGGFTHASPPRPWGGRQPVERA